MATAGVKKARERRPALAFLDEGDPSSDVLVDIVRDDGAIVAMNEAQRQALRLDQAAADVTIGQTYAPASALEIEALFSRDLPLDFQMTVELTLVTRGGRGVPTLARCRKMLVEGREAFRISKIVLGPLADMLEDVRRDSHVLRQIIDNASEGHWCIEFLEPIDISAPRQEVIDQVFENASIWRIANRAMARLYDLPDGELIRAQDVRLYWPRSAENEEFVGQIVDSGYFIDAAISYDKRHDGSPVYCENDVRADIEDGFLRRIWGNCRDVTEMNRVMDDAKERVALLRRVIDGVPDPLLVVGGRGEAIGCNRAFTATFASDGKARDILAKRAPRWRTKGVSRSVRLPLTNECHATFQCHADVIEGSRGDRWTILTLRRMPVRRG